ASHGAAGHLPGARVAEVGLLCAAAGVRVGDPHHRTLPLVDLATAAVAHEHRFPSHHFLLRRSKRPAKRTRNYAPFVPHEYAKNGAGSALLPPPARAPYLVHRRHANGVVGNRRSFFPPRTAR